MRPQSRDELAEWYAAALEEPVSSGLSMAARADQVGGTAATLYTWSRRSQAEGAASIEEASPASGLTQVAMRSPETEEGLPSSCG